MMSPSAGKGGSGLDVCAVVDPSVSAHFALPADCSLNYPMGKHVIHEVANVSFSHLACEEQAAVVVHWSASPLGTCLSPCLSVFLPVYVLLLRERFSKWKEEEQESKTFPLWSDQQNKREDHISRYNTTIWPWRNVCACVCVYVMWTSLCHNTACCFLSGTQKSSRYATATGKQQPESDFLPLSVSVLSPSELLQCEEALLTSWTEEEMCVDPCDLAYYLIFYDIFVKLVRKHDFPFKGTNFEGKCLHLAVTGVCRCCV